ncbi:MULTISPECIES: hypothetical protein [Actinomycetes]|uniref:alpha/beta hydrolase family protein n=1 Tax=Actinomycetes TaxID=1760 RepID=UPI0018CC25FC|nr:MULTISPECIES: hypothetical protein [Actinomycetes]
MASHTLFSNDDFDGNFDRTLYGAYYGTADLGEAFATGRAIGKPTAGSWHQHWRERADQVRADAEASRAAGHRISARDAYLRASEYYRQSYFFLRHDITDTRLLAAFEAHRETFASFAELTDVHAQKVAIPYRHDLGETSIHGWLFAADDSQTPRPTLISPCGYDSTAESGWFTVVGALERGYNVLSVEGPGQGASLYYDKIPFRPDAEVPYGQIMDWVSAHDLVDPTRIAMMGRSFAGYLGPRAVAADNRYAALVCDPAQPDMGTKIPGGIAGKIAAPAMTAATHLSADKAEFFGARMAAHHCSTIAEYFDELKTYTMLGIASQITCPTLLVESEGDPVGGGGATLIGAISSTTKELVNPPASSGLSGHCGGLGQKVWERIVFDWLDTVLTPAATPH